MSHLAEIPWAALGAAFGAVVGSLLSLLFARRLETARVQTQLRHQAYVDFLTACVDSEVASRTLLKDPRSTMRAEGAAGIDETELRALLYGDGERPKLLQEK